jgi:hypothetical protein
MSDLERLAQDPDFILTKRFGYSLQKLVERYPDGAPDHVIAAALGTTETEVERRYQDVVRYLKGFVGNE